jgi:hypothetical protein
MGFDSRLTRLDPDYLHYFGTQDLISIDIGDHAAWVARVGRKYRKVFHDADLAEMPDYTMFPHRLDTDPAFLWRYATKLPNEPLIRGQFVYTPPLITKQGFRQGMYGSASSLLEACLTWKMGHHKFAHWSAWFPNR